MHNVNLQKREVQIGPRRISIETGKLAKQADGSVVVRMGDTVVLVTACHAASPRVGIDFLPLTVDYREYTYASGRIPGGFFKREGKPPEKEVLTSRLIDRPVRPLFAAGWNFETQIIALLLSADQENDADVLAITGASAALALSEIPFEKTIAGVRVGIVDGNIVSDYSQRIHVPDDWKRSYRDLREKNNLASNVDLVFLAITIVAALVVFIIRLRRGDLSLRFLLVIGPHKDSAMKDAASLQRQQDFLITIRF